MRQSRLTKALTRYFSEPKFALFFAYVQKIQKAGGFRQYEALCQKAFIALLEPKFPQLPAEVIPTIVAFWAHAGDYCMPFVPIELDPLVARIVATLRIRPII